MTPASYVIVNRATGKAVQEVFGGKPTLAAPLLASYEVVPIMEWLQRVNEAAKRDTPPERTNYPGGFEATSIIVFLYEDGRQNFTLGEFVGGRRVFDKGDQESLARCVKNAEIDVTGMDWNGIIKAADKAADDLRGCTWTQWVMSGGIGPLDPKHEYGLDPAYTAEPTPAGMQLVIPGCEMNASPKATQLALSF